MISFVAIFDSELLYFRDWWGDACPCERPSQGRRVDVCCSAGWRNLLRAVQPYACVCELQSNMPDFQRPDKRKTGLDFQSLHSTATPMNKPFKFEFSSVKVLSVFKSAYPEVVAGSSLPFLERAFGPHYNCLDPRALRKIKKHRAATCAG